MGFCYDSYVYCYIVMFCWAPLTRTESKGSGLQGVNSNQFSVPAFGSTNFLEPRKLLRTVLSRLEESLEWALRMGKVLRTGLGF